MDLQEGRKETIVSFGQVTSEALDASATGNGSEDAGRRHTGQQANNALWIRSSSARSAQGQRIAFVPLRRRRGGDRWGYDDETLGTHGADSSRASDLSIRLDVAPLAVHES
jgi:hypothetical protein